MKRCAPDHQVHIAADPVVGLSGRKAPSSMGKISALGVLRLRATSAAAGDKPVRRSAQDDESLGELTKRRPLYGSRAAQDDDSVGEPQEKQRQREAGL